MGHTVTEGVIEPRFGGKHVSADVGMLELYGGGHQVALEIEGDQLRAIHPLGKVIFLNISMSRRFSITLSRWRLSIRSTWKSTPS